jgi:hydroxymethylglutaryl-CoA lyase/(R)-citramalyl-CoA lyase
VDLTICEVGPRDGLQNEPEVLTPQLRAELANRAGRTGVARVEVASFVNPKRVPQMAGAEEVFAGVLPREGVTRAGLVLNRRGYDRLRTTSCEEVHIAFCVTETFNQRNQGCSIQDSVSQAQEIIAAAHDDGRRVTATLAASFGCPFEGRVDSSRVFSLAERLTDADEIVLADTIGVGTPKQVNVLVGGVRALGIPVGLHLHNTRNTGYANAVAGIEADVSVLDASLGGIGGCPFAPGAAGNIATDDLVNLLHQAGIATGVDVDRLVSVRDQLHTLLGRRLDSALAAAKATPAELRAL